MPTRSRSAPVQPGGAAHARMAFQAHGALQAMLGPQAGSDGALAILLFLHGQEGTAGVTTAACCAALPAPRTTVLRWIKALAEAGLVRQEADAADGRVTRLGLSPRAAAAVQAWLVALAGEDAR